MQPCLLFPVELCLLFSGHLHKRNLIRLAACKRHGVTDQFTAASLLRTAAQERNSRGLVALLPCLLFPVDSSGILHVLEVFRL